MGYLTIVGSNAIEVTIALYTNDVPCSNVRFIPSAQQTYERTVYQVYRAWYVLLLDLNNFGTEGAIPEAKKIVVSLRQRKLWSERQQYLRRLMPNSIAELPHCDQHLQSLITALDKVTSCYMADSRVLINQGPMEICRL